MSNEEWTVGEFEEFGGYDCMTCGIEIGPAKLDGISYGQEYCKEIDADAKSQMLADAKLIGAAKQMLRVLRQIHKSGYSTAEDHQIVFDVLQKAGDTPE